MSVGWRLVGLCKKDWREKQAFECMYAHTMTWLCPALCVCSQLVRDGLVCLAGSSDSHAFAMV